jgi:TonB family protein
MMIQAQMRRIALCAALTVAAGSIGTGAEETYRPARLADGRPPASPAITIAGGGEVLLELSVDPQGRVSHVDRLRTTPPYTDMVAEAVETWRFTPAEAFSDRNGRRLVDARVLVAAVYRAPALYNGRTVGEVPKDVAKPSISVPVPEELLPPSYPPNGSGDAVVLLEAEIGADGTTKDVRVVHSGGGFDAAALQAVQRWTFRPARSLDEGPLPSFAYVIVGFRQPIQPGIR